MHIINNNLICDMSPYAAFWSSKPSDRPSLLTPVNCPECNKAIRGRFHDLDKYVLTDGVLPDMFYSDLSVSEKFRLAWLDSGLKGIADFLPLPVYQRKNKRHVAVKQPYYSIVVNVPHLKVDIQRSRLIKDGILAYTTEKVVLPEGRRCWIYWQCPTCGYVEKTFSPYKDRLAIDWLFPDHLVYDGNTDDDIFAFTNVFNGFTYNISGSRFYMVSDRFISFVKENKLTNVYVLTPEEARLSKKGNEKQKFTPVYTDPSVISI